MYFMLCMNNILLFKLKMKKNLCSNIDQHFYYIQFGALVLLHNMIHNLYSVTQNFKVSQKFFFQNMEIREI